MTRDNGRRLLDVLHLIADGHANRMIARKLGLSEPGAKARVRSLLADLGATNRAHAVAIAYQRRLLPLDPPRTEPLAHHQPGCALLTIRACNCEAGAR